MSELAAKRWAKALIELTQESEEISGEKVLEDLRSVADTINSSEELHNAINNPSVSTEEKQIVLCRLFQDKVISIVYNFIFALNLKKRIGLISEIAVAYQTELENLKNIVRVDVTSAIEINNDKKDEIKNRIAEKLQKDVRVNWDIDTDIIAGLIFNINDIVVDNSIRHKLDNLSKNITKSGI